MYVAPHCLLFLPLQALTKNDRSTGEYRGGHPGHVGSQGIIQI